MQFQCGRDNEKAVSFFYGYCSEACFPQGMNSLAHSGPDVTRDKDGNLVPHSSNKGAESPILNRSIK